MALSNVLSAVRRLILEEPTPDADPEARRRHLRNRFPDLTDAEIQDLAEIPPARLKVYTRLIFNGERSMLKWIYPVTFAALARIEPGLDDFNLIRDLHRHRPWTSQSSRELADILQDYVTQIRKDWQEHWPGLTDLIEFERLALQVYYAPDSPHRFIDVEEWGKLSVGKLMEQSVEVAPYVAVRSFCCDVVEFNHEYRREGKLPEDWPTPARTFSLCSRHPESLMPRWLTLSQPAYHALSHVQPGEPVLINNLAQRYIDAASPELKTDEQVLFQSFFTLLTDCAEIGAIVAPH